MKLIYLLIFLLNDDKKKIQLHILKLIIITTPSLTSYKYKPISRDTRLTFIAGHWEGPARFQA